MLHQGADTYISPLPLAPVFALRRLHGFSGILPVHYDARDLLRLLLLSRAGPRHTPLTCQHTRYAFTVPTSDVTWSLASRERFWRTAASQLAYLSGARSLDGESFFECILMSAEYLLYGSSSEDKRKELRCFHHSGPYQSCKPQ